MKGERKREGYQKENYQERYFNLRVSLKKAGAMLLY